MYIYLKVGVNISQELQIITFQLLQSKFIEVKYLGENKSNNHRTHTFRSKDNKALSTSW